MILPEEVYMSRAERKLAEIRAKAELAKLKVEKREKQQEDWEDAKQKWTTLPKGVKTGIKVAAVAILAIGLIGALTSPDSESSNVASNDQQAEQKTNEVKQEVAVEEKTPKEKLKDDILNLITAKTAFDTGSYIKGDIPQGEYAFVSFDGGGKYYSEEDDAGNIIDNENFNSFGYVYVHGVGNITTKGVLIATSSLGGLGVTGAKEIYEKLNDATNYKSSGMYKVGTDISAGQYTLQSQGSGYVAVLTGPVGNNEIVDNENFNGRHSVSVKNGQYLSLNRAEVAQ